MIRGREPGANREFAGSDAFPAFELNEFEAQGRAASASDEKIARRGGSRTRSYGLSRRPCPIAEDDIAGVG